MTRPVRPAGWDGDRRWTLVVLVVAVAFYGCRRRDDAGRLATAEADFAAAMQATQQRDHARAIELWDQVLSRGGLSPDFVAEALVQRGVCLARRGKFRQAEADLQRAAQGAAPDVLAAARSYCFAKAGRSSESAAAWKAAQRLNPDVVRFED